MSEEQTPKNVLPDCGQEFNHEAWLQFIAGNIGVEKFTDIPKFIANLEKKTVDLTCTIAELQHYYASAIKEIKGLQAELKALKSPEEVDPVEKPKKKR